MAIVGTQYVVVKLVPNWRGVTPLFRNGVPRYSVYIRLFRRRPQRLVTCQDIPDIGLSILPIVRQGYSSGS